MIVETERVLSRVSTRFSQKWSVFRVRFADQVRCFIGGCCHFFFQCLRPEFWGHREHTTLISNATYSPWKIDTSFGEVMREVSSHSLLDKMRLYELWQLASQVKDLPGEAIEVGCWRGGSGCLIAYRLAQEKKQTTLFLCDTFCGVVKAGEHDDFYKGNEFADTDESIVADLADRLGLKNIKILRGVFPEETAHEIGDHPIKFAHIDVDVYQSVKDVFEWLFPRLVVGAIVVFDDYGSASTKGIRKYIDGLQGRSDLVIVRNLNGQAVVVKR